MCVATPDLSSRWSIWSFGRKYGPLARICSGSLDRLVLGHLCTDRPENTCNRIARVRGRTIGHGSWAAGHGVRTWGTASKQWQVSNAHLGRAPATRKAQHRGAMEAHWRPLAVGTLEATSSAYSRRCRAAGMGSHGAPLCAISRTQPHAAGETSETPSPKPRD
jgi:hypothetical protein